MKNILDISDSLINTSFFIGNQIFNFQQFEISMIAKEYEWKGIINAIPEGHSDKLKYGHIFNSIMISGRLFEHNELLSKSFLKHGFYLSTEEEQEKRNRISRIHKIYRTENN